LPPHHVGSLLLPRHVVAQVVAFVAVVLAVEALRVWLGVRRVVAALTVLMHSLTHLVRDGVVTLELLVVLPFPLPLLLLQGQVHWQDIPILLYPECWCLWWACSRGWCVWWTCPAPPGLFARVHARVRVLLLGAAAATLCGIVAARQHHQGGSKRV